MITLAIDTSAHLCAVAVHDERTDAIVAERSDDIGRGHAERLMGVVGEVLDEAGIGYDALGRVAASVGPGSFTGVRVGLATARGIALGLGIPAVGVSSLKALAAAAGWRQTRTPLFVVLDARRGEAYAQWFGAAKQQVPTEPFVAGYDRLADMAGGVAEFSLCGSGAPTLTEIARQQWRIVHTLAAAPIADYARLGAAASLTGVRPEPLYLRPPDAKPQKGFALPHA